MARWQASIPATSPLPLCSHSVIILTEEQSQERSENKKGGEEINTTGGVSASTSSNVGPSIEQGMWQSLGRSLVCTVVVEELAAAPTHVAAPTKMLYVQWHAGSPPAGVAIEGEDPCISTPPCLCTPPVMAALAGVHRVSAQLQVCELSIISIFL